MYNLSRNREKKRENVIKSGKAINSKNKEESSG
jgi:hypothetical protein